MGKGDIQDMNILLENLMHIQNLAFKALGINESIDDCKFYKAPKCTIDCPSSNVKKGDQCPFVGEQLACTCYSKDMGEMKPDIKQK
jgi:hypothetical protein